MRSPIASSKLSASPCTGTPGMNAAQPPPSETTTACEGSSRRSCSRNASADTTTNRSLSRVTVVTTPLRAASSTPRKLFRADVKVSKWRTVAIAVLLRSSAPRAQAIIPIVVCRADRGLSCCVAPVMVHKYVKYVKYVFTPAAEHTAGRNAPRCTGRWIPLEARRSRPRPGSTNWRRSILGAGGVPSERTPETERCKSAHGEAGA
ncbi:exported protein of unknown function [Blastococcus saxobsidens DD2]|uniref:Uncharacterized protein n=1 Tax=Blastococcus saxobsidens (strain DD2) TaxID=1146883 RepID=H6RU80_BLASD|nr:exported protein of unknown function [Blastococcus saxobsidens DD2]